MLLIPLWGETMISLESPYIIIIYEFRNASAIVNKAVDNRNCFTRKLNQDISPVNSLAIMSIIVAVHR